MNEKNIEKQKKIRLARAIFNYSLAQLNKNILKAFIGKLKRNTFDYVLDIL
jgi:hypothetical protein